MQTDNRYYLKHYKNTIEDDEQSRLMYRLMELQPHISRDYTYDEMGAAALVAEMYPDIRYCSDFGAWYIWDGSRWKKQQSKEQISDKVQTLFNLLLYYCKEIAADGKDSEIQAYERYCKGLRKKTVVYNVIELLKSHDCLSASVFDTNPYMLNTPRAAYDLKTMKTITNRKSMNPTQCTACNLPSTNYRCERWYSYIDQIMSYNKEKSAFLQRALGYSILGINRDECMFIAYGSRSRNGKSTLLGAIEGVLGKEYMGGSDPMLICEGKNSKIRDFNAPQPALRKLVSTRLVTIAEINRDQIINAAMLKSLTGRDTLTTRGLHEGSFDFIPQFTIWVNTNHLPSVSDDTVFRSDRVWVITFDESFDEQTRDRSLKELFAAPENKPTILQWLVDGCIDYFKQGLNPPNSVRTATNEYRERHDRIGCFIKERCTVDHSRSTLVKRSDLYNAYHFWCVKTENRYKPLGTVNFYAEIEYRGFPIKQHKVNGKPDYYVEGITLSNEVEKV